MSDLYNSSISEIMKPTHLRNKPLARNKSLIPVGIIPKGKMVQYNNMIPKKDYDELLKHAKKLRDYLTRDVCDSETIVSSAFVGRL